MGIFQRHVGLARGPHAPSASARRSSLHGESLSPWALGVRSGPQADLFLSHVGSGIEISCLTVERLEERQMFTATVETLHSFLGKDGQVPDAGLTLVDTTLYGTTAFGGASGDGTIFSMNADGSDYKVLYSFSGTDGERPAASLTVVDSTLYGTTVDGGSKGDGAIFSLNTLDGQFRLLHSFSSADAIAPDARLTLVGNLLYGTTYSDGAKSDGAIFSINFDGSGFNLAHSFAGTDGKNPVGNLILDGSTLYGTTAGGGADGNGTVFSINTLDTKQFKVVHSFSGAGGSEPDDGLVLVGSTLYGTTAFGGSDHDGTIFSLNTDGTGFRVLHSFSGADGKQPRVGLTLVDSTLYGTTQYGGSADDGAVFSIDVTGAGFQVVHSFSGTDGSQPIAGLTLVGSNLIGATDLGGSDNDGTIFAIPGVVPNGSTLQTSQILFGVLPTTTSPALATAQKISQPAVPMELALAVAETPNAPTARAAAINSLFNFDGASGGGTPDVAAPTWLNYGSDTDEPFYQSATMPEQHGHDVVLALALSVVPEVEGAEFSDERPDPQKLPHLAALEIALPELLAPEGELETESTRSWWVAGAAGAALAGSVAVLLAPRFVRRKPPRIRLRTHHLG